MSSFLRKIMSINNQVGSERKNGDPFGDGMRIIVRDLSYHVPSIVNKKERAYLLKDVSGFFESSQMAALMGPSGSGKTTLLDVLAGRKNAGITEGTVLFGGVKPTRQFLRKYTGYVEQFDTLIPSLTVYEMLLYTAELKRPRTEPYQSKLAAVENLLDMLALRECSGVKIGNELLKGISGGQAKRVNIGIGLVAQPRILFLDEPTSGLDSFTSNEVMTVVRGLLKYGVTICATIHSPSAYCFSLFDRLMMLVRGRVVYFGLRGCDAIQFAQSACPDVKPYLPGYNDAEYLVDLVTEGNKLGRAEVMAEHYAKSSNKAEADAIVEKYLSEPSTMSEEALKELATNSATVTPWWYALLIISKFRLLYDIRDPTYMGPRIGDKLVFGIILMTLYLNIGTDFGSTNIGNIASVLFLWTMLPGYGAAAYVPALVLERPLFLRERADGLYYTFTYLLAKMFGEVLVACVVSIPVSLFVFYGIQFSGDWVLFWLVYWITFCNGIMLAYMISAISPNLDVANALVPAYVTTLLFFAGYFILLGSIPPWWYWFNFIDFLHYGWVAHMVNVFENVNVIYLDGMTTLEYYQINTVNKWAYVGFESLFFFVFFMLALAALTFKKYSDR